MLTFLADLWMPIILSAVLVFAASALIHMVLKWHNSDYRKLANEDAVRAAIRAGNPAPGQYVVPHCPGMKEMQTPEAQQKFVEGPVGFVTLVRNGPPRMGGTLALWFLFTLAIGVIAAYIAARALPTGATFGQVFRVVGTLSCLAYAGGAVPAGIWMGKPWSGVAKEIVDGLIYGALTGAVFAWLWPR
jgi:hypothetical protein